jgi:hypothetical protein
MLARSVLRWLQTIDLSQPYTNPRLDFASGYLIAEICAKYIPTVSVHSFSDFLSVKMRKDNWDRLLVIFKGNNIPINAALVDEVMKRQAGSITKLIEILYTSFTHRKPCHCQIGEITKKKEEIASTVSTIIPIGVMPEAPKKAEEPVVDAPPVIPKRQKFIGASSTERTGSQSDATPISFESASVVKSGPGFLQLRSSSAQTAAAGSEKALDNVIKRVTSEGSPEALQAFAKCMESPEDLSSFLADYPSDMILDMIQRSGPYFSPESCPYIISTLAELFIPAADLATVSVDDLIELIFALPSADPFTHHFLLDKILEVTDPPSIPSALRGFVSREKAFSRPLTQFILQKVRDCVEQDTNGILPEVLTKLLEFDRPGVVQLIPLFAASGEPRKDINLADLYIHAADESIQQIRAILENGDRGIAAYLLDSFVSGDVIPKEGLIDLILAIPDPHQLLTSEYSLELKGEGIVVTPLITKLDPLSTVQLIAARIAKLQPDSIDKEIIVMSVLMKDLKPDDIPRWGELFQSLHEYLYISFCDENVCKEGVEVCLVFFKLLQNEVFGTFSDLFKALTFVFQSAGVPCPAPCKAKAIEFLTTASEMNASFGQSVLKLLMNFPPKTNPDLDKLIAHLRKVGSRK